MTDEALFYKASGKFSLMRLLIALPIMTLIVWLVSYLYAFLLVYNPILYLSLFIFIGYLFALSAASVFLFTIIIKSRNAVISSLFGGLSGLAAIYFSWGLFIKVVCTRFDWESIGYDIILHPAILWAYIVALGEQGYYSIFDVEVSGIPLWTFWSIEALGLFLAPMFFTFGFTSTTVFCEACNQWAEEKDGVLFFAHPNEEILKTAFLAQDLNFLENAEKVGDNETDFYRMDAEWCKECDAVHALSLRRIKRSWDDKGKEDLTSTTIYEDMLIRKETHDRVFAFATSSGWSLKGEGDPEKDIG